jgi:hypothetical protein
VLSGGPGLLGSAAAASYAFLKYAKLGELNEIARAGGDVEAELAARLLPPGGGASGESGEGGGG